MDNWHSAKMKEVAKRTMAQLLYSRKDLREVIAIQEESNKKGFYTPKLDEYIDELHYVNMEIRKRNNDLFK